MVRDGCTGEGGLSRDNLTTTAVGGSVRNGYTMVAVVLLSLIEMRDWWDRSTMGLIGVCLRCPVGNKVADRVSPPRVGAEAGCVLSRRGYESHTRYC